MDPQYRSLTRERKEKAATKTRVMQMIDDPRALNIRLLPQVTAQKRVQPRPFSPQNTHSTCQLASGLRAAPAGWEEPDALGPQVVKSSDTKRLRMDRDALENMLFGLFERQAAWPFMQLEKETKQPVPWLKVPPSDAAAAHAHHHLPTFAANRISLGAFLT